MEWFWDSRRGGGSLQWQALEIAVCIPKKWGDLENGWDFERERVCVCVWDPIRYRNLKRGASLQEEYVQVVVSHQKEKEKNRNALVWFRVKSED